MARSRLAARSPVVRPSLNVDLTAKAALPAASSRDFAIWIAPVSPPARSATPHAATNETSSVQTTRATAAPSMSRSRAIRRLPSRMPHCRGRSHRSPGAAGLEACSNSHGRPGAGPACLCRKDAARNSWPASSESPGAGSGRHRFDCGQGIRLGFRNLRRSTGARLFSAGAVRRTPGQPRFAARHPCTFPCRVMGRSGDGATALPVERRGKTGYSSRSQSERHGCRLPTLPLRS